MMKAYVLDAINEFNIKDVEKPICGDDVVVKVQTAGICGSDIPRVYTAGTYHYPLIPGHEFSGTVVEVCENNSEWIGKRVGVFPLIPCMKCPQCLKKQYEMCSDYNYLVSKYFDGSCVSCMVLTIRYLQIVCSNIFCNKIHFVF